MRRRKRRSPAGSVSVFTALILLPMITLGGVASDAAKIYAAETAVSGAADLALNAVLSEYDKALASTYGLYACSAGINSLSDAGEEYFRNSLTSSGIFDAGDGYTRSIINRLFGAFGGFSEATDGIVRMTPAGYSVTSDSASSLGNPVVLERQVIDFMKYRAPLLGGIYIGEKAGLFSGLSGSSEAVSRKLKYDNSLSGLQTALDRLCDALDACFERYSDSYFRDGAAGAFEALLWAKSAVDGCVSDLITSFSAEKAVSIPASGDGPDTEGQKAADILADAEANGVLRGFVDELIAADPDANPYAYAVSAASAPGEYALANRAAVSIRSRESAGGELIRAAEKWLGRAERIEEKTRSACGSVRDEVVSRLIPVRKFAERVRLDAVDLSSAYYEVSEAADELAADYTNVSAEREKLRRAVERLEDGPVKQSLEEELSKFVPEADGEALKKLKDEAGASASAAEAIGTFIQRAEAGGFSLADNGEPGKKEISQLFSAAEKAAEGAGTLSGDGLVLPEDLASAFLISEGYARNDPVLGGFISSVYSSRSVPGDAEARALKDGLVSYAVGFGGDDGEDGPPLRMSEADATGCFRLINLYASTAGIVEKTPGLSADLSGGSGEEITESASDGLGSAGGFLSSLASFAESAASGLAVSAYITDMFSCRTDGIDGKSRLNTLGSQVAGGVFDGCECEYILFGQDRMADNLAAAYASIFALRFVLNTIFALTDPGLRESALAVATSIAGWSGFGVPVVQNLLLVCLSVAESLNDMRRLKSGASVVVYKSPDYWKMSPEGLLNTIGSAASGENGNSESDKTPAALSYREYIGLFMIIIYPFNRINMLSRCSKLIQVNMSVVSPGFVITSKPTVVECSASVSVVTVFRGFGESNDGSSGKTVKCRRIAGY